jgi:serine/threonine protein kinase
VTSRTEGTSYNRIRLGLTIDRRIELLELIGSGAQGQVWRVRELGMLRRECAAKLLCVPAEERRSALVEQIRVDFENETKNLGILEQKRFVINLHYIVEAEVEIEEEKLYILALVMELSEIGDLGKFIQTSEFQRMQPFGRIEIMKSIAQGLQEAHAYQIFHSDIKPSNILMFREGKEFIPKLADFGVATRAGSFGGPRGTPAYMAPEVLGGAVATSASDIFSLGLLFHEIVTGMHPFAVKLEKGVGEELTYYRDAYSRLRYDNSRIADDYGHLAKLITRMLDGDPLKRPRSTAVVSALQGIGAIIHVTMPVESGPLHQDRFVWNPEVHLKLGCRRHLYFLHSSHPESDVRWLQSRLREVGAASFTLHRVLGAYDFVLDCWLDAVLGHKVDRVVEAYENERRVNRLLRHEVDAYEPKTVPPDSWADLEGEELIRLITGKLSTASYEEQREVLEKERLIIGTLQEAYGRIRILLKIEAGRDLDENESDYYCEVITQNMLRKGSIDNLGYDTHRISRLSGSRSFLIEFDIDQFTSYGSILFGLAANIDKKMFTAMRVDFFYRSFLCLDARPIVCSEDGLLANLTALEFRYTN